MAGVAVVGMEYRVKVGAVVGTLGFEGVYEVGKAAHFNRVI